MKVDLTFRKNVTGQGTARAWNKRYLIISYYVVCVAIVCSKVTEAFTSTLPGRPLLLCRGSTCSRYGLESKGKCSSDPFLECIRNNHHVFVGRNSGALRMSSKSDECELEEDQGLSSKQLQFLTMLRVSIPSILAGWLATKFFPSLVKLYPRASVTSDFVGNFLSVVGLLYSLLVGQTYGFVYSQQEALYYALYNEVTEAKSLLEQIALVSRGRAILYPRLLKDMSNYVRNDLCSLRKDPAVLLSARPVDDPLESIMYLTSVGVPGDIYQTVKSLREARAVRLGALQRKVPPMHMILLYTLAAFIVFTFPLLSLSSTTFLGIERILFGILVFSITITKRVMTELWRPAGGAYNVDAVLQIMIKGLESELKERMSNSDSFTSNVEPPQNPASLPIQQQGPDIKRPIHTLLKMFRKKLFKLKQRKQL